jgi:DNA (cytosine-5)-methyltransferase 1
MRYGSVCSGIEAASVAWEPLGWTPAWFCEIDPFPSAVLANHYPQVPNYGDFTKLIDPAHPVHANGRIDLLVGGTPCQAFSVAGLRQGLADPRGGLTLEFLRLARALRPRWIVWENVPGVLSQDGGRAFGAFLGGLEDLGYGWAYRVLDAQYTRVDGYPGAVPQRRKRVFVVGHSGGDFSRAATVLLEPEGVRRDSPPRRASRKGTTGDAAGGIEVAGCLLHRDAKGIDSDTKPGHILPVAFDTYNHATSDVSQTIKSPAGGANESVDTVMQAHGFYPSEGRDFPFYKELSPTVKVGSGGNNGSPPGVCITGDRTHALKAEGADASEDGTGRGVPIVAASMAVRRLTPVECERLQGFPDDYTRIQWKKKSAEECPDGGRYKALGNSMAVNCMRWIGRRIQLVDSV